MSHFGDNVVSFFKQAATKLEELQVQSALGKAELSDKLEEYKKDALHKYAAVKAEIRSEIADGKEEMQHLKAKMEHLELQLALGRAENAEKIHEQKNDLKATIHDIRSLIDKD